MGEIILVGFVGWMIFGVFVAEVCRMWNCPNLDSPDFVAGLLWPVVLIAAVMNGRSQ